MSQIRLFTVRFSLLFWVMAVAGCREGFPRPQTPPLQTSASTFTLPITEIINTQYGSMKSTITPTKSRTMRPILTTSDTLSPCPDTSIPELNTRIDASSAHRLKQFSCLTVGDVNQIAYSADGTFLAVSDARGVSFYDPHELTLISIIPSESIIRTFSISPNGKILATGSDDNLIRLWRISDGALFRTFKETAFSHSVIFSPDGDFLANGSSDWTINIFRISDGELLHTLIGHESSVTSVVFSPDGKTLASGSLDGFPRLWRVSDGMPIRHLYCPPSGRSGSIVAFSPDGKTLVAGYKVFQISDGNLLRSLEGETRKVKSIAFSPDGSLLTIASDEPVIRLWYVPSGVGPQLYGHTSGVTSIAFSPDGFLLASGSTDGTIRFWGVAE
jgi:WD40 repeat protein